MQPKKPSDLVSIEVVAARAKLNGDKSSLQPLEPPSAGPDELFRRTAAFVMEKNAELYKRLA